MKICLLLTLTGLAISFAVPAFSQQPSTPDPKLHEEFIASDKKFDDAFINGDAAALAAFYAEDAVIIPHDGPPNLRTGGHPETFRGHVQADTF